MPEYREKTCIDCQKPFKPHASDRTAAPHQTDDVKPKKPVAPIDALRRLLDDLDADGIVVIRKGATITITSGSTRS